MFSCLRKNKKKQDNNSAGKKEKKEKEPSPDVSFGDTDDDIDADEEWIATQYQTGDFDYELESKIQGLEVLEQKTCKHCRYVEYYISFNSLCIPEERREAFIQLHPVTNVTTFILNEKKYCHVEMANAWVSEIDMLYIPFSSKTKINFVLCDDLNTPHITNYYTCNCAVDKRIDPERWEYYKTVRIN